MEKRSVPYTGDDLIGIGKAVKRIEKRLKAFETYSGSEVENDVYDLSTIVSYEGEIVGTVTFYDGWFGFYPDEVPR